GRGAGRRDRTGAGRVVVGELRIRAHHDSHLRQDTAGTGELNVLAKLGITVRLESLTCDVRWQRRRDVVVDDARGRRGDGGAGAGGEEQESCGEDGCG